MHFKFLQPQRKKNSSFSHFVIISLLFLIVIVENAPLFHHIQIEIEKIILNLNQEFN